MGPSLLALFPLLAAPQFVSVPEADSFDPTHEILEEMEKMITPCVQPTTTPRVFTLCLDTHSSIHAHWAAYRIARVFPDLDDAALTSEVALEANKLAIEVPFITYHYAAAWFLRLAIDFELWSIEAGRPDPFRLRPVADQMAAYLTSTVVQAPAIVPTVGEYGNQAWMLYQLHSYYELVGNAFQLGRTEKKIRTGFGQKITNASFGDDITSTEFFSIYGNWNYVFVKTQAQTIADAFLMLQNPIPLAHLDVPLSPAIHANGMVWSRIWALRAMSAATPDPIDRDRFARAAALHVENGWTKHQVLKGDFFGYDHWVPQFAVYAVTEGLVSD